MFLQKLAQIHTHPIKKYTPSCKLSDPVHICIQGLLHSIVCKTNRIMI